MLVHGLRLLVALITFGVGLAASALLGSESRAQPPCRKRVETSERIYVFKTREEIPKVRPMSGHFRVEGGNLDDKAVFKPQPVYPPLGRALNFKGTMAVRVQVATDGRVISAHAVSGPPLLREAAEEAALRATFTPTLLSGEPVSVGGLLTYDFDFE